MKTNIEAIAIKNLQEILRERGYTAEALFSKFDSDLNGTPVSYTHLTLPTKRIV